MISQGTARMAFLDNATREFNKNCSSQPFAKRDINPIRPYDRYLPDFSRTNFHPASNTF